MRLATVTADLGVLDASATAPPHATGRGWSERPVRGAGDRRVRPALEMTVAYSKERVQFGRPIGSFQALKHRMADMLVLAEMSRSASWAASYAVATGSDDAGQHAGQHAGQDAGQDAGRLAHVAKSYCCEAFSHLAGETVQMHGGIAITWEHDAHLVFKRAHALGQLFGTPAAHQARVRL